MIKEEKKEALHLTVEREVSRVDQISQTLSEAFINRTVLRKIWEE